MKPLFSGLKMPPYATAVSARLFCGILAVLAAIGILLCGYPGFATAAMVTDQVGRQMQVPDHPRRVVALAPSLTEIVYALGQEHHLVGVTRFSDYPPQARSKPKVGSYVHLDLERIVALQPDLCLAIKDGNPKAVVNRLVAFNIPVYAVDPRNLQGVGETVRLIGHLLNAPETARQLVSGMEERIEQIRSRVATTTLRPKVFFQIGISPIVSVGTDTFIHELIIMAGGTNLTAGSVPYPRYSREQVLGLAPEIFIITSMARGETFKRVKKRWSRWKQMPAVANQRLLLVDSNLFDRATPRLIDGLELLARLIHPDLFPTSGQAPPKPGKNP